MLYPAKKLIYLIKVLPVLLVLECNNLFQFCMLSESSWQSKWRWISLSVRKQFYLTDLKANFSVLQKIWLLVKYRGNDQTVLEFQ